MSTATNDHGKGKHGKKEYVLIEILYASLDTIISGGKIQQGKENNQHKDSRTANLYC